MGRCKKTQKSTSKVDGFAFPKYLVFHLQRKDGDQRLVDCPLKRLDLSKYRGKRRMSDGDDGKQECKEMSRSAVEVPSVYNLYGAIAKESEHGTFDATIKDEQSADW